MAVDHLRRFLIEIQKEENATAEDAQDIIDGLGRLHELRHLNIFHKKGITLEAFFKYLFSDTNAPLSSLGVMLMLFLGFFFGSLYFVVFVFVFVFSQNL